MSGIYISGMKMPKDRPMIIKINPDGSVSTTAQTFFQKYKAIPVPEHGGLIDASTKVTIQIYDDMYEEYRDEECTIADTLDRWSNEGCPEAIIPADKEKKT